MITAKQLAAWATSKVPTNEALAGITPESRLENAIEARDDEHRAKLEALRKSYEDANARGGEANERLQRQLREAVDANVMSAALIERLRGERAEATKRADALESLIDTERQVRKEVDNTLVFVRRELAEARGQWICSAGHRHGPHDVCNNPFPPAPPPAESTPVHEPWCKACGGINPTECRCAAPPACPRCGRRIAGQHVPAAARAGDETDEEFHAHCLNLTVDEARLICECGSGMRTHVFGGHRSCEYFEHHCDSCHERGICTAHVPVLSKLLALVPVPGAPSGDEAKVREINEKWALRRMGGWNEEHCRREAIKEALSTGRPTVRAESNGCARSWTRQSDNETRRGRTCASRAAGATSDNHRLARSDLRLRCGL